MENLETLNQAINAPQTQGDGQNIQGQGSLEQNIQEPQAQGNPQIESIPNDVQQQGLNEVQMEQILNIIQQSQIQNIQQNAKVQEPQQKGEYGELAEALGISEYKKQVDELKQELEKLNSERNIINVKNSIAEMEGRLEGFKGEEIFNYLNELNKTNPAMAQGLDNPQGWEMIYNQLRMQQLTQTQQAQNQGIVKEPQAIQVQNNPDLILASTQNQNFVPNDLMNKIKSGNATYSEMGKIFG